jgi:hypothetical protein
MFAAAGNVTAVGSGFPVSITALGVFSPGVGLVEACDLMAGTEFGLLLENCVC